MESSRFVWRVPDLVPFIVLGVLSFSLPFIPFLNQPGIVLVAYTAICLMACYFLVRFPADRRPDQERDEAVDLGGVR